MWLLGGCEFPRSFRILDFSVESFTDEQFMRIGPDPRIHKDASIVWFSDRESEKKRWWLVLRQEVANGWVGKQEWDDIREKKWEEEAAEREKDNDGNRSVIERVWAAGKGRTTTSDKDR